MEDDCDFFLGESAPVSALNTARIDTGRHSARDKLPNSAKERRLTQEFVPQGNYIKENQSNQSFDSHQSELYDIVVPLDCGIRRNAMDSHDIQEIEKLVFQDPIFQRHRKQPPSSSSPLIVVQNNCSMNNCSDAFAVHSEQFIVFTNSMGNNNETLSILPSGDITPILTPFVGISHSTSFVGLTNDFGLPKDDAVHESILQARQALSEKFPNQVSETTTNLEDNISSASESKVPSEKSQTPTRIHQSLCDNESDNQPLDDDAIIAKMIMGSCRRQLKPTAALSPLVPKK